MSAPSYDFGLNRLEARMLLSASTATTTTPLKLAFTIQPTQTFAGSTFSVAVSIEDQSGNVMTDDSGNPISIWLAPAKKQARLSGTLTEKAVDGVATFSGLSVNKPGSYTLQAIDPDLLPSMLTVIVVYDSNPFRVLPHPKLDLAIGHAPRP